METTQMLDHHVAWDFPKVQRAGPAWLGHPSIETFVKKTSDSWERPVDSWERPVDSWERLADSWERPALVR